jgi:hypothetical protein
MTTKAKTTKPKLKTFRVTAVIPTVQYGNIQPEYEIEAKDFEEAEAAALPYIEKLWAKYCAKGSELPEREVAEAPVSHTEPAESLVTLKSTMTTGQALFDRVNHVYYNDKNEKLLGGSTFAKRFQKPFDKENILKAMEDAYGIPKAEIAAMWELKGEASTSFGTGLHAALELYGKYKDIGEVTGAKKGINSAMHDHPVIQKAVEEFYKGREKEDAVYEEFVVDEDRKLCGQLDRVLIVDRDKKICRVQDFKTNADVEKKGYNKTLLKPFTNMKDTPLSGYWIQLSFYANILQAHGWTVEGLDVFAYNGEWTTYMHDVIDLSEVI